MMLLLLQSCGFEVVHFFGELPEVVMKQKMNENESNTAPRGIKKEDANSKLREENYKSRKACAPLFSRRTPRCYCAWPDYRQ